MAISEAPVATADESPSSLRQFRRSLDRTQWLVLAGMAGFIVLLHVVGWGVLFGAVAPKELRLGDGQMYGVALGVTAYVLGMRHAFDADHIAAIDNTTRKLVAEDKKPLSVGFWFSLGHSSIVFGLCLLLGIGVKALSGQVENEDSTLQQFTGVFGTSVSGLFLIALGMINLVSLIGILGVWSGMRSGVYDEQALEHQLDNRGLMNRILRPVMKGVRQPRHMYPVGFLFGLGFDTATEVSLLVLAAGSAAVSVPWYAILVLPVLFAAGMSLLDSIDGVFMNFAYGWAFARPVRKVYYNIVITGLSVAVALVIGLIEIDSILVEKLSIDSGPLHAIGTLDLNYVGYVIAGLFALTWAVALLWWRFGRVEERWSAGLAGRASSQS
ncbi:HoxN/HupN/NixA family nickel/cobalt transporter [Angustibacter sp. McL0619]|uniref:HoxN/HupN/NixA family nickel/cobalt transporter n=1 Tax=Angustibacter sp. McL0619 TaxID=3415676 RepID=UPI003CECDCB5